MTSLAIALADAAFCGRCLARHPYGPWGHVDVAGGISETHPAVTVLDVDGERFEKLLGFINDSFIRESGAVVSVGDRGYGDYDRFFEARGYFNALFGCNTWTAAALRTGGLRTGFWNPLPQTLVLSLSLYN